VYVEKHLSLHTNKIHFKVPRDCSTEYLEVRLGTDKTGNLIGRYCNSNTPPESLNTKAASIWINFVKTKDTSASFAATWTAENCKRCSNYSPIKNL
jgi:hypothetical protein